MEITVYSTRQGSGSKFETSATTWGELKKELYAADLYTEKMKAVLGTNKATLESNDYVLPTSTYTVFMLPIETKSGVGFTVEKVKTLQSELNKLFEEVLKTKTSISQEELNKLRREADALLASLR